MMQVIQLNWLYFLHQTSELLRVLEIPCFRPVTMVYKKSSSSKIFFIIYSHFFFVPVQSITITSGLFSEECGRNIIRRVPTNHPGTGYITPFPRRSFPFLVTVPHYLQHITIPTHALGNMGSNGHLGPLFLIRNSINCPIITWWA